MSIQNFYTVAQVKDFARIFQFRITQFGEIAFDPAHFAYVESASLPGRSITNVPVTYMGLDFNTPGTAKYPGSANYSVQFRCDQAYDIRTALEAATFRTFDESVSMGTYGVPGDSSRLVMELFDKNLDPVRIYTLYGVWVQSLGDVSYDVKDSGTVQTIQAVLAYQYWRATEPNADNGDSASYDPSRMFQETNPSTIINQDGVIPQPWGILR